MSKAFITGVLAGAVSVIGGTIYKVHSFRKNPDKGMHFIVNHLDKRLHLTSKQRVAVEDLIKTKFNKHSEIKEKKKAIHSSFSDLFLQETFESSSLTEAVKQDVVTPMVDHIGEALEELHAILSSEQRREFIRLMERHHGHHGCCHH